MNFSFLSKWLTPRRRRAAQSPKIRARYDLAQQSDQTANYWAAADALDADAANSLAVRKRIRERARYEEQNNPVLEGICNTEADYEIGTGPTLQVLTSSPGFNSMVEAAFSRWARSIDLAGKLWTMARARVVDGESFALLVGNPMVSDRVKLDVRPIECDQFSSPFMVPPAENYVDGITLDAWGNPITYDVLRRHPGAEWSTGTDEYDRIPAEAVLHWFRPTRAGQHRGVSEIRTSCSVAPGVRRFNSATIKAAETAASIALALETDCPPGMEPDEVDPGAVDIPMGSMFQTPFGWKSSQIRAEHPNSNYGEFLDRNHGQEGRPLSMPRNVATCDSSGYNFASGQLDHLTYFASIGIKQSVGCDRKVMAKIFAAWFRLAVWAYQWSVPDSPAPDYQCYWVGKPHSNPVDESTAIEKNLGDGVTTYPLEYARRGLDYEAEQTRQAEALGVTLDEYRALLRYKLFGVSEAPKPAAEPTPGAGGFPFNRMASSGANGNGNGSTS